MCIMDSKSKLIHRPGIKGNESILNEGFESLPTEFPSSSKRSIRGSRGSQACQRQGEGDLETPGTCFRESSCFILLGGPADCFA